MTSDNPDPCPAPSVLAQMLMIQAWSDRVDDDTRRFHEWSAECITMLLERCVLLAKLREQYEAEAELLRKVAYGPQKGGAA
jgi:hypothetical protein